MEFPWGTIAENGGLFGVIAALIYMTMAKDKSIDKLRDVVGALATAISTMTELVRIKESYDESVIGITRQNLSSQQSLARDVTRALGQTESNATAIARITEAIAALDRHTQAVGQ